ncbi:metal-dependent hydrolase [gamma proteobacterium HTCC5015]|nr:metal-dependent hydrolase [gamma proteobacterium HTCC5015]
MATARNHSGAKKTISPRKMDFPFEEIDSKYWYNGNALLTTFFAALSATFPPGEQQFIDSVRYYRNQVKDKKLLEQIRGFIGQEGHHSHQHKKANQELDRRGLFATRLEEHLKRDIKFLNRFMSPASQLAATAAAEHITAIMAEYVLTHPEVTAPMADSVGELIEWHAVEEIEHKAVAFDVYMQCVGDRQLLRRSMVMISTEFSLRVMAYQAALLYWDRRLPRPSEVVEAGRFLFGKRGMIRKMRKPFMEFFRRDFHPWDVDNTHLIEQWKAAHKALEKHLEAA